MFVQRAFYFLFVLNILSSCNQKSNPSSDITYFNDLEELSSEEEPVFIGDQGFELKNGELRSDDFSRSGKYSIRLDENDQFGLSFKLDPISPGEYFKASIWQKNGAKEPSFVAKLFDDQGEFLYLIFSIKDELDKDWLVHHIEFAVPPNVSAIEFYVYSGGKECYFDDFELVRTVVPQNEIENNLSIDLSKKAIDDIEQRIKYAYSDGIIRNRSKKYVNASLYTENWKNNAKVRLKGDWLDHIRFGKTSLRIKLKGESNYLGMQSFSIQHPITRRYLDEWILHKLAESENILTTKYEFTNLRINGFDQGIYAVEEHFDKTLLERNKRREGPILKLSEDGFWDYIYHLSASSSGFQDPPFYQSSIIGPFKQNRTISSDVLFSQFKEGAKLVQKVKYGNYQPEEIYDVDEIAKYYAFIEVFAAEHASRWHNRRFYLNPITQKLENIFFDGNCDFSSDNQLPIKNKLLGKTNDPELLMDLPLFLSAEFKESFIAHLSYFASTTYLDSSFEKLNEDILILNDALAAQFPFYSFEKERFYERAEYINTQLDTLEIIWQQKIEGMSPSQLWIDTVTYHSATSRIVNSNITINAYLFRDTMSQKVIVENYHIDSVEILALQLDSGKNFISILKHPEFLKPHNEKADVIELAAHFPIEKIFFRAMNNPEVIFEKKVLPWSIPNGLTSREMLQRESDLGAENVRIQGDEVIFSGEVELDHLIMVPSKYTVTFQPGTNIRFIKEGGLIVGNNCFIEGTQTNPVNFISEDSLNNGLTILNAEQVVINHANFNGLSNLAYKNWILPGGVNIYQGSV
ncbi:MAG: CotH kinase family protein, partial [Crocinitomicaceae bacterium]